MIRKISIFMSLLIVCFFLVGPFVHASAYEQEFVVRPGPILSGGADRLDLRFNIRHARVTFKLSEDPSFIVKVFVRCDSEEIIPVSSESFSEGTFSVVFSSGAVSVEGMANPLHDWEIQIGRYDLETNLTLDFTGVQAGMDLGGMPLDTLVLNLKGTRTKLDFSEPTLFSVRKFGIT